MPTVPSYGGFNVGTSTGPDATFATPTTNPGQIGADQVKQLGDAAVRAGGTGVNIAADQFDIANQIRVNDAMNKARVAAQTLTYDPQTGYKNLKGDAAITRPGGLALPDEYGQKLQDSISEISGTLGNDVQRRNFGMQSKGLSTQFQGDVQSHMLTEFQNYRLSTNDATIDLAANDAKLNWSNPDKIFGGTTADGERIPGAIDQIKAAAIDTARAKGLTGAPADEAILNAVSGVHRGVIMAALENNNPNYALMYLAKARGMGQMSGDDILRVQGLVNQNVWARQSMDAVQGTTSDFRPQFQPNNFDRMTQITAASESGNRDFDANGSVITSSAGAKGRMQVMDATAANPGFGIKPADLSGTPQQQADERARVGTQYLQALVQKYGDPAKAWAAYNAGPGRLDQALKDAAAGRSGSGDWLSYMPAETQAYVQKNVTALGATGNMTTPRPTEMAFVNAALAKLPPGASPQVYNMTREAAVTQFGVINKTLSEQADNSQRQAQNWLIQNKGDIDGMPAELRDAVMRSDPMKMAELTNFGRTIARGTNVDNPVLFNRLAAHPDELFALSDAQWESMRSNLSQRSFDRFSVQRGTYLNGNTKNDPGNIDGPELQRAFSTKLAELQIPTPLKTDVAGQEWLKGTNQFVRDSLYDAQHQIGRKFTPEEIGQHLDNLFGKDVDFRSKLFGFIPAGTTDPVSVMSLKVGDIPSDSAEAIKQSFAKRGITPNNTDILNAYRRWKLGPNTPPPGVVQGRGQNRAIPPLGPDIGAE